MKGGKHHKKKKEKTNGTTVYVGSFQTVYIPLFFFFTNCDGIK